MVSLLSLAQQSAALAAPVGDGQGNAHPDVLWVKQAMRDLGRYHPQREALPIIDMELLAAVRRYQRDRGLRQDGLLRPGGPTECCLRAEAERVSRRPLP
ncbi:MAG: hypothetical protein H7345_07800 [Rubritepida sp.]|nr:hypothetical protein [Rubritepida sp.]